MGIKRSRKQLAAAAIALAGIAGGAVAAHATNFAASAGVLTAPASFPVITPTCTTSPCNVALTVGSGSAPVSDVNNPGTTSVPFIGFGVNTAIVGLAGSPNSTIKVAAGTVLNITVSDPSIDLSFPSLPLADVVDNGGGSYTVTANTVGTSVFQPGENDQAPKQIARGLVGVLIVTPAGCTDAVTQMCGYSNTPYEDEALIATTDLDLEFATNPGAFDMGYFGQSIDPDFSPRQVYHFINGKAFPDTDVIEVRAGDDVLLRYVNAGVSDKTMGTLGLRQSLIARNSSAYTDPQTVIAPLVGPGETADIAVAIPAGATAGQFFAVGDQGHQMNNGTAQGFGGAMTFLNVRAAIGVPTVDTLTALAATSAPVAVGNPLVDRQYATDFPTPIGTLSPVLVALPATPLSAGTLQSFNTWNQAAAGGSPTPSAGGLLHAYVLRPTGNANEYDVIYDSGELTVPPLSGTASEAVSFPTGGVAVQTGDVLAYFGQGVPTDTAGGTDVLVYDPANTVVAPADGDTITLGSPDYPIYPQARTYSFGATLAPYSGTTSLTATGHSSGPLQNVTGYQTVVNNGSSPGVGDWSATTPVGPAATVSITATVSAVPGQTVWIRVQQDGAVWSSPANIVVPVP